MDCSCRNGGWQRPNAPREIAPWCLVVRTVRASVCVSCFGDRAGSTTEKTRTRGGARAREREDSSVRVADSRMTGGRGMGMGMGKVEPRRLLEAGDASPWSWTEHGRDGGSPRFRRPSGHATPTGSGDAATGRRGPEIRNSASGRDNRFVTKMRRLDFLEAGRGSRSARSIKRKREGC